MSVAPLSRRQIIRAAVDLLDDDGVDGLSMRRLAGRMGAGATSIYWYVKSKDTLVVLAADEVFGEIELPDPDTEGWRVAATTMAHSMRATILRHPWLALVIASQPTAYGPMIARCSDHSLGVYQAAGFTGVDLDWAAATVFAFVHGMALGEAGEAIWKAKLRRDGVAEETALAEVMSIVEASSAPYPRLRDRVDAQTQTSTDPDAVRDESFDFGLQSLLDGFTARLGAAHPA